MKQKDILAFTLGAIVGTLGALLLASDSGNNNIQKLINKIKKAQPEMNLGDRNLYNLSELSADVSELEKLRTQG